MALSRTLLTRARLTGARPLLLERYLLWLTMALLTIARLAGARPLLLERPVRVRGEDDRDPTRVDVLPPGHDVYGCV
eukprot:scaffold89261_cov61-Phaeocystis_antarctica.AAC.2